MTLAWLWPGMAWTMGKGSFRGVHAPGPEPRTAEKPQEIESPSGLESVMGLPLGSWDRRSQS